MDTDDHIWSAAEYTENQKNIQKQKYRITKVQDKRICTREAPPYEKHVSKHMHVMCVGATPSPTTNVKYWLSQWVKSLQVITLYA